MIFRFFIATLLAATIFGCNDDIPLSEIPSVVENTFKSHFPDAVNVEWETHHNDFEVDFEMESTDYSAIIDQTGTMAGYKYEIANEKIPASIINVLNTKYSQKWEDPEILIHGENSYFQIEIDGFLKDKNIVLDREGKLIDNIKNWN